GWVALLWILALAKARSAAPISAASSAERATPNPFGPKSTQPWRARGRRAAGPESVRGWLRRSVVPARCGDAPHSLLAICPSASTRDPFQYFKSLLGVLLGYDSNQQT